MQRTIFYRQGFDDAMAGNKPAHSYTICCQQDWEYSDGWHDAMAIKPLPPFVLRNDPPPPSRERFENTSGRQAVLFSGLDCLPDQQDLFDDV